MKAALYDFLERHPLTLGGLSVSGGGTAALLKWFHVGAELMADVGMYCGGATAVVTFCLAVRNWRRERAERAVLERHIEARELRAMYDEDQLP